MLNCRQATEICSAEMERPLRLREQLSLRAHLMMCRGCTHYHRQMKTLRQVMRAYAEGKADAGESVRDGDG